MKIGIITQPLQNNYGGLLQNYALLHVIKNMGHEVETIDHSSNINTIWIRKVLSRTKGCLLHVLFPKRYEKPRYIPNEKEYEVIRKNTNYFINKYISRTKVLNSLREFDDIAKTGKYDAYVVGSDQCWRPKYNGAYLYEMFLRFAERQKDVKRIAYAASFGTTDWEFSPLMTELCANLIKKFDVITVRESSGVLLCKNNFGVDAAQVLDPTLLLDKEDYEKLVENENEPHSIGNLFYYILDPTEDKQSVIDRVSRKYGLIPFTTLPKCQEETRSKWDVKKRIDYCVFPSVTSWLRGFIDARMVIVDSFHGAVFSIIFNKPFWVLGNYKRGNTRFESLLGLFGLEDRMITVDDNVDWTKPIDWNNVNTIRERERRKSMMSFELLS